VHSDEKYFKNEQKENGKKIIIKRNATSLG
jgi:hypothetical protein